MSVMEPATAQFEQAELPKIGVEVVENVGGFSAVDPSRVSLHSWGLARTPSGDKEIEVGVGELGT